MTQSATQRKNIAQASTSNKNTDVSKELGEAYRPQRAFMSRRFQQVIDTLGKMKCINKPLLFSLKAYLLAALAHIKILDTRPQNPLDFLKAAGRERCAATLTTQNKLKTPKAPSWALGNG